MAAAARVPVTGPGGSPTLEGVDVELRRWRDRLAAASRNVSELSELPDYLAAKQAASGTGRLAAEARGLVATVDELWQGVLLIGAALDRAEGARRGGSRLWRGDAAAAEAMAILTGASISVDLSDTPVLHRSLLGGARARAVVSPEALLATMEASFTAACDRLTRLSQATEHAGTLQRELEAAAAGVPEAWAGQLQAAAAGADALDRLEALEALRPALEAARRVQAEVAAARRALEALTARVEEADAKAVACRAAVIAALPAVDAGAIAELGAWLDRIGGTLAAGRTEAARIGLANWQALHDRVAAQARAAAVAADASLGRLEELRARLGLLRAKRRVHAGTDVRALEAAAAAALGAAPVDLAAAAGALRALQAGLAS